MISLILGALFLGTLAVGGQWFENRLNETRQTTRQLADDLRDRTLSARRAQYVADIRQIPLFLDAYRTRNAHELLVRHRPKPGEQDIREFAWYHLWNRCHTARQALQGHRGDVYYVEFSPRGDLLASAGKDGAVRIWDASNGRLIRGIEASSTEVNVAAFSPDGKSLATVDDEGKLKLWEIATGRRLLERLAHQGEAVIVRFTPDGGRLITGGRKDGFIKIWDRTTGEMRNEFRAAEAYLENAVVSPDGAILACVGLSVIKLCRIEDASLITALPTGGTVQGVAFSHDGTKLATANEHDNSVDLWETASGRRLRAYQGHTDGVFSVVFSADDRTLFTAGDDLTIRRWDVATGTESGVHLGHTARIWNLAMSADGRTLASASQDGAVMLWDTVPPNEPLLLPIPEPAAFRFSPDGRTLTTFELGDHWAAARWDVRSGSMLERTPLEPSGTCALAAISRDACLLAVACQDGSIVLRDLKTGQARGALDLKPARVPVYLEFSPDSRFLLVFSGAGRGVWDLESRRFIPVPKSGWNPTGYLPSGELICQFSRDMLGGWDPSTGRARVGSSRAGGEIGGVIVSLDGRRVITNDTNGRAIQFWSAEGLEIEKEIVGLRGVVGPMALSRDGNTLAVAGVYDTVKLWDVAMGEELVTLRGFHGPVSMMGFSPDGKALATLSTRGVGQPSEIKLWRAAQEGLVVAAVSGQETRV